MGTYAEIHISVDEDLPPSLPAHEWRDVLELPAGAGAFGLHSLLGDFVPEQPGRVLPSPQHELRIGFLRIDNRLLHVLMDRRFDRAHEACAHVDALSAKAQRRRQPLAVCEPTGGDERHAEGLSRAAQENEVRDVRLAYVPRTLETVDGEEIDAELDGRLRVADGGAFMQDGAIGRFQLADHRAWAVPGCLNNRDPFVNDGLGIASIVRRDESREEGKVHAEGVWGHLPASLDFMAEGVRGGLRESCEL